MFATVDLQEGLLRGTPLGMKRVLLRDLMGMFRDAVAYQKMAPDTPVYSSQVYQPAPSHTSGGLFWGITTLQAGSVGDEYFMTRGHFHATRDRSEFYFTVRGSGRLLLMTEQRSVQCESMYAGTLHYIPGCVAHRVANIGTEELVFLACWPSDAGYDYESIVRDGFAARIRCVNDSPMLVGESPA